MRKYEEHIFCDKCGKNIDIGDEHISLWGKNHNKLRLFKVFNDGGINVMNYDFCKDCAKEVEAAIKKVIKGD